MMFLFALLGCLVASSVTNISAKRVYSEKDLRRHIFADYDKFVRPAAHPDSTITVSTGITPLSIRELDTKTQVLVMDTYMLMKWNDDFLKWDPSEFNNITELRLPNSLVWKPDLSVYTASRDDALFPTSPTNVIVDHNGSVLWVPYFTIKSRCPLKKQGKNYFECVIKIGSWTYSGKLLNPQLDTSEVDLSNFEDSNPSWKLVTIKSDRQSQFYPCCPGEDYPAIHFNVTLKRRWPSVSMENEV
ncbi:acetylcholine receptor subunit alpha-L1-like [Argiope bruennichi]|uniref:Acetylcholine receptor subunit alpha-type like protein n=1 Tax=Argiope bruennichi TaxID=94029 RepID=A0A8T0FT38_ARGBR|nr:acetylcholine receptor subunit alpha-L1-like [Argiope bruennichi]KAF8793926.1 Acetylcholine receptor subunit alpha-type like protein [Argiope bruennichi]